MERERELLSVAGLRPQGFDEPHPGRTPRTTLEQPPDQPLETVQEYPPYPKLRERAYLLCGVKAAVAREKGARSRALPGEGSPDDLPPSSRGRSPAGRWISAGGRRRRRTAGVPRPRLDRSADGARPVRRTGAIGRERWAYACPRWAPGTVARMDGGGLIAGPVPRGRTRARGRRGAGPVGADLWTSSVAGRSGRRNASARRGGRRGRVAVRRAGQVRRGSRSVRARRKCVIPRANPSPAGRPARAREPRP